MDEQEILDGVNTWPCEASPYAPEVIAQWQAEFLASCQTETE